MALHLLGQGGKRETKKGAKVFPGNELGQMRQVLFRYLGKVNVPDPASRLFPVGLGSLPLIGFFQQQEDSQDAPVRKDRPPGKALFQVNSPEVFPQGCAKSRCLPRAKDSAIRADFNGDERRLFSMEEPEEFPSPSRIPMNGAHQQQGGMISAAHTHP
jgi:hypothetical protein